MPIWTPARRAGRAQHLGCADPRAHRAGSRGDAGDDRQRRPDHAIDRRRPLRHAARPGRRSAGQGGRLRRRHRHPPSGGRPRPRSSRRTSRSSASGLDIPEDQVQLYLAVRELAHARLFRHAKWLRLQLITSDHRLREGHHDRHRAPRRTRRELRPVEPGGAPRGDGQRCADPAEDRRAAGGARPAGDGARAGRGVGRRRHGRGDHACCPKADAIAETVRRRRASGGPAESAFATLVGLELRPAPAPRCRGDVEGRERCCRPGGTRRLWSHPDLLPTGVRPRRPVARSSPRLTAEATGEEPELDAVDQALEDLLRGDTERPDES